MESRKSRLKTVLKFKKKQNSCYFIIKRDLNVKDYKVNEGGMFMFTDIPSDKEDYIYMVLLYKTKPLNSEITITNEDEGLIHLSYDDLIILLVGNKIEAFYTDKNLPDSEIGNLIKTYKR